MLQGYSPALIEPGRLTVPAMLKQRGYYTAGLGKWHLGLGDREKTDYTKPLRPGPLDAGFDYYFGIPSSLDFEPYLFFENDRPIEQPTATTEGSHAAAARRVLAGRRDRAALRISPGPAHAYRQGSLHHPGARQELRRSRSSCTSPFPRRTLPWVPVKPFLGRSKAGLYGDFVAQVDDTLGRVAQALDDAGLAGEHAARSSPATTERIGRPTTRPPGRIAPMPTGAA